MAGDDPEVGIAAERAPNSISTLDGRLQRANGFLQNRHKFAEGRKRLLKCAARRFDDLSIALTSCRPLFGGAPKSTFLPLGSVTIIVLAMGRSPSMLKQGLVYIHAAGDDDKFVGCGAYIEQNLIVTCQARLA